MIKHIRFVIVAIILIALFFITGKWTMMAEATNINMNIGTPTPTSTAIKEPEVIGEIPSIEQQEELKTVIQSYFDIRYRALSVPDSGDFKQNGFGSLVSNMHEAGIFVTNELGKLAVEIKHAELNHIRYAEYKYFLDFHSIVVDTSSQLATVSVIEKSEFVDETSLEISPEDPFVSHSYHTEHIIVLHKEHGEWKIVSDEYTDYLWNMIRRSGVSTDKMMDTMKAWPRQTSRSESTEKTVASRLPVDGSSHNYNRQLAVQYAVDHIAREDYNPNYPDYNSGDDALPWGDCTNFISQAIYEGGNASMFIPSPLPGPSPDGQSGWYLLNDKQRASAWADVNTFYTFVTYESLIEAYPGGEWYGEGPQGYEVTLNELMLGDVIQYDWTGDGSWDHAAIVVDFVGGNPIVATHTPDDIRNYLAFAPSYNPDKTQIRLIHIERSNGFEPVSVEIISSEDDAGGNPGGVCPLTNSDPLNNYLGGCFNGGQGVVSGFLFRNIQIPKGAQIKYAFVNLTTDGTYTVRTQDPGVYAPISLLIRGETTATPLNFSPSYTPAQRQNLTDPPVSWPINRTDTDDNIGYDTWGWKGKRTTPDISYIIGTVTGLNDWVPGSTISLIFENGEPFATTYARRVIAFEGVPENYYSARLITAYDLNTNSLTFNSIADNDGYILEFSENSEKGRYTDTNAIVVGDESDNRQYRSILHFNTNSLPDNAVITSAILRIKSVINSRYKSFYNAW